MTDNLKILQLRATMFISQNIGYSLENAEAFKQMLQPDGQIKGILMPGYPITSIDQNAPQWGMPWSIFKQKGTDTTYSINFLPNKIDIIMNKETLYNEEIEISFIEKSVGWLNLICNKISDSAIRLAYAPLYAYHDDEDDNSQNMWKKLIKITPTEGVPAKDINLTYNYKKQISLESRSIQVNLLHNLYDGIQTIRSKDSVTAKKMLMVQLDLNSIPEANGKFSSSEIITFFQEINKVKKQLVEEIF